jgi:hypothetical protein
MYYLLIFIKSMDRKLAPECLPAGIRGPDILSDGWPRVFPLPGPHFNREGYPDWPLQGPGAQAITTCHIRIIP